MRGFGGMGNMGGLMAQAQKMQAKLAKVQEEIAAIEIDGEAGSGAVKVRINGKHQCVRISIDPSAISPDDVEMLEDLVRSPSTMRRPVFQKFRKSVCARRSRFLRA